MTTDITKAAAALGRKGGQAKTEAKQAASRNNGKRGGRPRAKLLPEQTRLVVFRRIANGDVTETELGTVVEACATSAQIMLDDATVLTLQLDGR